MSEQKYCYWCGKSLEEDQRLFCSENCKIRKQFYSDNYKKKDFDRQEAIPDEVFKFNDLWREEMKEMQRDLNWKQEHPLHAFTNECLITLQCCIDKVKVTPDEAKLLRGLSQAQIEDQNGVVTTDKEDYT